MAEHVKPGTGKCTDRRKNNHPPSKPVDWDVVGKLAQIQCTIPEIAFVVKVSRKTLYDSCVRTQGCILEDFLEKYKAGGRASLRRWQYVAAENGNITMQIWLGKQYLGQADKQEVTGRDGVPLKTEVIVKTKKSKDLTAKIIAGEAIFCASRQPVCTN